MPMIAITTSNSTRVNPLLFVRVIIQTTSIKKEKMKKKKTFAATAAATLCS